MPLFPLPEVLPLPDPGPRPMRFRSRCEPGAATRLCSPIFSTFSAFSTVFATISSLLDHGHLYEVPHLLELPNERRMNVLHDLMLMMMQADRLQRCAHAPRMTDAASDLLDANLAFLRQAKAWRLFRTARAVPNECARH